MIASALDARERTVTPARLVPLMVLVVTALALLLDLGSQNVWSKDEARDGLVARDMVEMGYWLIPHIGGRVYPDKPPLFHWLVALVSPRGVTEWSLRLPSVMAAAGTVTVTYAIGARLTTPATGLVAAAMLASSSMFVEWARMGRLEMALVFWITLAFWSAMRWFDEGKRCHALVLGLASGCGCLTKGPLGLLPLGALMVALVLLGRWRRRTLVDLGLALSLSVTPAIVWLGLAASTQAGVGRYVEAVVAKFGDEVSEHRHRAFLATAEAIGMGFLPWTLLVPGALLILLRTWRTSWRILLLPLLWVVLVLLIFTMFISPRAAHFLPMYPALAILVARAWSTCSASQRRWMSIPLAVGAVTVLVVGLVIAVSPMTIGTPSDIKVLGRELGLGITAVAGSVSGGALLLARRQRPHEVAVLVGVGALLVTLLLQIRVYTPRANRTFPTREVAARLAAGLAPSAQVAYLDRKFTTGIMFYMPQRPVELPETDALRGWIAGRPTVVLLPYNEVVLVNRDMCLPLRPLREESIFGERYVLADFTGAPAGRCPERRP